MGILCLVSCIIVLGMLAGWIHFPGADVGDGAGEYGGKVGKREKFEKKCSDCT